MLGHTNIDIVDIIVDMVDTIVDIVDIIVDIFLDLIFRIYLVYTVTRWSSDFLDIFFLLILNVFTRKPQ